MGISWNTGDATSSGGTPVTSWAVTIPGGVGDGDVIIVAFTAFGIAFEAAQTVQASSTGTAPAIIGASQTAPIYNDIYLNAAIFSVAAGASDAGKVITGSVVSGATMTWAAALGAWTGASNASPADVSGAATASGASSTISCPSETTAADGDWCLQIMCAALGGSAYTGGTGFTQRESIADPTSGAAAAIFDSNGSVGAAGTSIGGAAFANAGNNSWWAGFTVGLAPATVQAPAVAYSMRMMP